MPETRGTSVITRVKHKTCRCVGMSACQCVAYLVGFTVWSVGGSTNPGVSQQCEIVLASWNPGKVNELKEVARVLNVGLKSALEIGFHPLTVAGETLLDDAQLKAVTCAKATKYPAISDSAMLLVPSLGGLPGFDALEWAGPGRDWNRACHYLNEMLATKEAPDRKAVYECAMCFALPNGKFVTSKDSLSGKIVWPPRGQGAFDLGFYSVFVPEGESRTLLEMEWCSMANMNHRYYAFQELVKQMFIAELVDLKIVYNPLDTRNKGNQDAEFETSPLQDVLEAVRPPGTAIVNNEYIKPYVQPGKQHISYPSVPCEEDLEEMHDPDVIRDDCLKMIHKGCELRRRAELCRHEICSANVNQGVKDCDEADELEREAVQMLENARYIAQRLNEPSLEAVCLSNLGTFYGESAKAIELWKKALQLAESVEDAELAVVLICKTASVQESLGNAMGALDTFVRALQIVKDQDLEAYQGRIYCSIAEIHFKLKEYTKV